ncbi:DUF6941 family protein [Microbacterium sp. 1.5R]|uniref:DUF6941 family protein n=1 Tax=Microbacterium sp. 1.5R TaxID=1916917 RepID=UPI0011A4B1D1|nr:hypothetical protein [Microbacterium sp. 1.5R]
MITLAAALLCDSANVRENLINILSGGVTILGRPNFPAPLGADLALSLYVRPDHANDLTHPVVIEAVSEATDEQLFALESGFLIGDLSDEQPPYEAQSVSVVFPLSGMGIPEPGRYRIEIKVDGELISAVPFSAVNSSPKPE